MKVENSGQTGKAGIETLNYKLSEERAKVIIEYFVQKGSVAQVLNSRYLLYCSHLPIIKLPGDELQAEEPNLKFRNYDGHHIISGKFLLVLQIRLN